MNRSLLIAAALVVGLAACSKKEEKTVTTPPASSPSTSSSTTTTTPTPAPGADSSSSSSTTGTGAGVQMLITTTGQAHYRTADGAAGGNSGVTTDTMPIGSISAVAGWRDRPALKARANINNGTTVEAADAVTTTIDNAFAPRVGRLASSGTVYAAAEVYAWGLLRRAFTADDLLLMDDIRVARFS